MAMITVFKLGSRMNSINNANIGWNAVCQKRASVRFFCDFMVSQLIFVIVIEITRHINSVAAEFRLSFVVGARLAIMIPTNRVGIVSAKDIFIACRKAGLFCSALEVDTNLRHRVSRPPLDTIERNAESEMQ